MIKATHHFSNKPIPDAYLQAKFDRNQSLANAAAVLIKHYYNGPVAGLIDDVDANHVSIAAFDGNQAGALQIQKTVAQRKLNRLLSDLKSTNPDKFSENIMPNGIKILIAPPKVLIDALDILAVRHKIKDDDFERNLANAEELSKKMLPMGKTVYPKPS